MELVDWGLTIVAGILMIPLSTVLIEMFFALLPARRSTKPDLTSRSSCAVLIPAHNEEVGIEKTITYLHSQLRPDDRIIVIADNCNDRTVEIAKSLGVEVIERINENQRGKGYALDFGIRFLEANPPEVVVILDADCLMSRDSIDYLVHTTQQNGEPTQALNLAGVSISKSVKEQISSFAFLFKNGIRAQGLHRLGFPCLLTGTGMSFPWKAIQSSRLSSGNIVEDMQLGVDLALSGYHPQLCSMATVEGFPAPSNEAALKQRTRWEHGHVQTIVTQVPRLLWGAIRQRRWSLLALALELAVPPLSLIVLFWGILTCISIGWWYFAEGSAIPSILLLVSGGLVLGALFLSWIKYGRKVVRLHSLLLIPWYIAWKLPIYIGLLFHRQRSWVRTERRTESV
jgi:cellulose synthase/poly-beta-1,6-N-acetylglucosamine synthase-like glycosyltransferase